MADFPWPANYEPAHPYYGTHELYTRFTGLAPTFANRVWSAANRARFAPIIVTRSIEITFLEIANGAVVNGNVDLGIYTAHPTDFFPQQRIRSTGSFAQAGVNAFQSVAVAGGTLALGPGFYYIGCVLDNGVGEVFDMLPGAATDTLLNRTANSFERAASFPLPLDANPTISQNSVDSLPLVLAKAATIL